MKAIVLCLLVLVSASCVLSASVNTKDVAIPDIKALQTKLDALLSKYQKMDSNDDYMSVEQQGFIKSVIKILGTSWDGILGLTCLIQEFADVILTCTTYVKAVNDCGVAIPEDIQAIIDSIKEAGIQLLHILSFETKVCDDSDSGTECLAKLVEAGVELVETIKATIRDIGEFPSNTSSCFVGATKTLVDGCNAFVPNCQKCIDKYW
ncbi:uncharacterized protein Dwil_GK23760 [Drosophila willistoni]|uniref:Protein TsetseEP domain-containing protein n=1 Tax=Drosophila willistoni TaxID=7260 RepID=B4MTV5_DROWI|nr:uncharacterized protein LOC6641783 [Drosophila willistoni]EDW75544.1 uncharacterized protein Dwil_GK23760 [Drosophila willistoni]